MDTAKGARPVQSRLNQPGTDPFWSQVPEPERARTDLTTVPRELLALFVTGIGPVVRSASLGDGKPLVVALLAVGVTVTQGALGRDRWALRLAAAVAAGLVVGAIDGGRMGAWMALSAVLSDWAVRRRRPLPRVSAPPLAAAAPVAVLAAVAAWLGRDPHPTVRPLLPILVAFAVTAVSVARPRTVAAAAEAVGAFAARAISTALFWVIGLVVVVAPWTVNRLARVDPLRRRDEDVLRTPVPEGLADPERSWKAEPHTESRRARWRRRVISGTVGACVVVGLVLATVELTSGPAPPKALPEPTSGPPAAYADSPWWNEYDQDMRWIMQETTAWSRWDIPRISDVTTRHVSVVDGARVSWTPPVCASCPRRSVWLYGGSTGFGFGQRDEGTIASWLARTAWKDGVALHVSNRSTPGDLHWQEANRLAWDILRDPAPDLVVFYDGVNELWSGDYLVEREEGDVRGPIDVFAEQHRAGVREEPKQVPPGASIPDPPEVDHPDVEFTAEIVVDRYQRSLGMSRTTLEAKEVPGLWFWQPSRFSRPAVAGEPDLGDAEQERRRYFTAAASMVPDGVHNLDGVLRDVEGPLFSDDVHHNERAARVIAEAMWPRVRTALGIGS